MDYVVVEANGGRLTATIDKSINNLSNADVTVTVPANGSIRALDASSAAENFGRRGAERRQICHGRIERRKDRRFGQGPILRRSRIERIENQRLGRSGLLQRGGFERIENHAERLGREVHRRPQLGRETFGRRLRRRRVLGKHFERGESCRKLHGASARRRIERQFDPLQRRLSDQHQQVERRQCRPQLTPKPSNHERG